MSSEAILSVSRLSKSYRNGHTEVRALNDVRFEVLPGELVLIVGPSGSGKSTLLRICGGLDVPSSGSVVVDGVDLTAASESTLAFMRRSTIGYVFQDYNLLGGLTATENIALPLEISGVRRRHAAREARASLEIVDLDGKAHRFPDELSGGERQRVAIARSIVGARKLLLADEPTGALDSTAGARTIATLQRFCSGGGAVVVVTHDTSLSWGEARRVELSDGRQDTVVGVP